jgi:acyl carrier protein
MTHVDRGPGTAAVRELVTDAVGPEVLDGVSDHELLFEQGILDSLALVTIVAALEQRFDIAVTPEDLIPENFRSITDTARFVSTKRGASLGDGEPHADQP